jgi:hypothetical protein
MPTHLISWVEALWPVFLTKQNIGQNPRASPPFSRSPCPSERRILFPWRDNLSIQFPPLYLSNINMRKLIACVAKIFLRCSHMNNRSSKSCDKSVTFTAIRRPRSKVLRIQGLSACQVLGSPCSGAEHLVTLGARALQPLKRPCKHCNWSVRESKVCFSKVYFI